MADPDFRANEAAAQAAAELAEHFPASSAGSSRTARLPATALPRLSAHLQIRHQRAKDGPWYFCLFFQPKLYLVMAVLGLLLALVVAGLALILPELPDYVRLQSTAWLLGLIPVAMIPFFLAGQVCAWFLCVLAEESSPNNAGRMWSGFNVTPALEGGLFFLLTFVSGPVLPFGLGLWFWMHSGDMRFYRLAYPWRIVGGDRRLLAHGPRGSVPESGAAPAHPGRVADVVHRLGRRTLIAIAAAALLAFAEGLLLRWSLLHLRESPAALEALIAWGITTVLCGSMLLRVVGRWHRQASAATVE